MLRSEILEREAEARRLELARTFDELRARATPAQMFNQAVNIASDSGGADLVRNLRVQAGNNPLALGLVGAGLAWLMMSGREPPQRRHGYGPARSYDPAYDTPGFDEGYYGYDEMTPSRTGVRRYVTGARERAGEAVSGAMSGAGHLVSDAAHGAGSAMSSAMSSVMSGAASGVRSGVSGAAHVASDMASGMASGMASMASDAAGSIASSARSATGTVIDTASSLGGEARHRAGDAATALYGGVSSTAGHTASGMRAFASGTAATSRDAYDLVSDQPLILAGLGLAFGAAMGAAFGATERECQLMGEASDSLKERTHAYASENYERSRVMAGHLYEELQHRMQEGGSSPSLQAPGPGSSSSASSGIRRIVTIPDDDIDPFSS